MFYFSIFVLSFGRLVSTLNYVAVTLRFGKVCFLLVSVRELVSASCFLRKRMYHQKDVNAETVQSPLSLSKRVLALNISLSTSLTISVSLSQCLSPTSLSFNQVAVS